MQLDEQIQQHIVLLPVELKAEVLDFVLLLEQKQIKQAEQLKRLALGISTLEERINEAKKGHLPLTQSFIGVLMGAHFDESDYKKYLEDKYL
jgi:hypothetical protein